jgi:hypothetical protein
MTRGEAEQACKRLAEEDPDRETHRWIPHQAPDGSWVVAKINLPPQEQEKLTAETRGDEKPPTPDDPRPLRDVGGPWVAGGG